MLDQKSFSQWASYHNSCYAGFSKWMLEDATNERMNIWRDRLGGYSVDELKQASYEHYRQPSEHKGTGFTSHLEGLEKFLRATRDAQQRERENASYYAHVCGLCANRGLVDVVAKPGREFADQHGSTFEASRCLAVACKCSAGDKYRAREQTTRDGKRWVGFATFDAQKHEPWLAWRRRERPHPLDDEFARVARLGLRQSITKCKEMFATFGEIPKEQEPR